MINDDYESFVEAEYLQDAYQALSIQRGGIQFPTENERTTMKTNEQLLTEAEQLREQALHLERVAAERENYGADPFKNGTVLKVDMKYRSGNRSYAYAVIKIGGRFYLSGRMGTGSNGSITSDGRAASGMTWDNFVAWLAQGDATVWRAKGLEQVL